MIFARLSRDIYKMDEKEIKDKLYVLLEYLNFSDQNRSNKKQNENDKLDIWLKRL
ncbi:hypothetical protein [Metaclostridioides mangenotii]|uniref:hypothetical protein n=1 Tax=Metaclostridioides mangenotii TaxID=1540 RepID=UPI00163AA179|nr:hypothetical protein [Clostridioides mangenotii]